MRGITTDYVAVVSHVVSLAASRTIFVICLYLHNDNVRLPDLILFRLESLQHVLNASLSPAYVRRIHLWIDTHRLNSFFDDWIVR